jgi:CheY-like chemotaxis protein
VVDEKQFRHRILLADDPGCLQTCSNHLYNEGYEVITAGNGFEALYVLRGAIPDLLITELNLPQMSGFELLAVVRKRFPQVAAIAISGDYTPANVPTETLCDGFVAKAPNFCFELMEKVRTVMETAPIRASRAKRDIVPVWIPRSRAGYIVLTCPECLRSFSVVEPKASPALEPCAFCGAEIRFEMSVVEHAPQAPQESPKLHSRKLREKSREIVSRMKSTRRT